MRCCHCHWRFFFAQELDAADPTTRGLRTLAAKVFSTSVSLTEGLRALVLEDLAETGGPRQPLRAPSFHRVVNAFLTIAPGGNTFPAPPEPAATASAFYIIPMP